MRKLPWERLRRIGDDVLRSDANHLGQLCLEEGLITAEQLREALDTWTDQGSDAVVPLGVILMRRGHLSVADLTRMLRRQAERNPELPAGEVDEALLDAERDPERCVGKFVLVAAVGEGGMGKVWKAWERPLRRWVALKFLKHDSAQHRDRFLREAEMAARLNHPNILPIYELGRDPRGGEERIYISMPFVEGEILGTGAMEPRLAAATLRTVAEAAHAAHEQGVLHRDLKPQNLIVDRSGRVYVMDFGLAKRITVDEPVTVSRMLLGTPSYMSPEQARGDALDRRADVYALGATLYHLLAGRPPFHESSVLDLLQAVQSDDPPRLRVVRDLEAICLKAMEKSPERRYATAADFAEDLGRWLAGEPTRARPPSAGAKLVRRLRRHPAAVTLVALVALLAAGYPGIRYAGARDRGTRGMALLDEGRLVEARLELEAALAQWETTDWRAALARIDVAERAARDVGALRMQYREIYMRLAEEIARAEAIGLGARQEPGEAAVLMARVNRVLGAIPEPWNRTSLPHAYRGWILCNLGKRDEGMLELQRAAEVGGLERGDPYGLIFRARLQARDGVFRIQLSGFFQPTSGGEMAELRGRVEPILGWPGWAGAREAEEFVTWLRAAEQFALARHAEAAALFESIVDAPEIGDEAMLLAAGAWGFAGRMDDTRRLLQDLVARRPEWVRACGALGYMKMIDGDFADAARMFERVLTLGYRDGVMVNYWAQCLMGEADRRFHAMEDAREDYRKAIAAFDEAIAANDTYSRVFHERGLCHQRLGLTEDIYGNHTEAFACGDRALADYERAIELNPELWQSHYCKGLVLELMRKPRQALAALEAARELEPDDAEVLAAIERVRAKLSGDEF